MGTIKTVFKAVKFIIGRPSDLRKFFSPTAARGKTVWPKSPADMLRYGVRWDYDGVITKDDGKEYHKFQLQPNAGKIPTSIKQWCDKHGGTHSVMTTLYILKGTEPSAEIFEEAMQEAAARIPS